MRFGIVAILGMIAATSVTAAQQANAKQALQAEEVVVSGPICPTGILRARRQSSGGTTMWTVAQEDLGIRGQNHRAPGSMGVHVNFDSAKNPVQSLELSVSYLPLKLRLMPVEQGANSKSDLKKTFVLKQEAALKINGDLLVGPAAAIESVHIVSATYADGTVWRAPNENSCTVVPSGVLLVGAK